MSDTAGVGPVNMTALHDRAAEVAERVIALDPAMGFALADIIDDERDLVAALENPVAAHMLVTGTLDGAVKALAHTPDALQRIRELDPMDPPGGDVTRTTWRRRTPASKQPCSIARSRTPQQPAAVTPSRSTCSLTTQCRPPGRSSP